MATQESSVRGGGSVLGALFTLVAIALLLGIGYVFWPKIKATYYAQPAAQPTQPPADTSALDAMRAQMTRMEAELRAAKAAQQSPLTVIQSVPQGEAAPAQEPVVNVSHTPASVEGQPPAEPARAPIVIVSHEGYQQPVITGSGACAVAKGARRCGK